MLLQGSSRDSETAARGDASAGQVQASRHLARRLISPREASGREKKAPPQRAPTSESPSSRCRRLKLNENAEKTFRVCRCVCVSVCVHDEWLIGGHANNKFWSEERENINANLTDERKNNVTPHHPSHDDLHFIRKAGVFPNPCDFYWLIRRRW